LSITAKNSGSSLASTLASQASKLARSVGVVSNNQRKRESDSPSVAAL
jgi:hypothetical protein